MRSKLSRYKGKLKYFMFTNKIIGRVACMGEDVLKGLNLSFNLINHQKNRADYIIRSHENHDLKPKLNKLNKHFIRKDIVPLILQQRDDIFSYRQPKIFFIDSYSELTDQKFKHKNEGWEFLSNYSDLSHDDDFSSMFENLGLLQIEEIENNYELLFSKINKTYNNIPIIFMHFPTTLDQRKKFKQRGEVILDSIKNLSKRFSNLHSFDIPKSIVDWPNYEVSEELKDFPYHYNNDTYQYLIKKIKNIL